jgi:hypothetical protein
VLTRSDGRQAKEIAMRRKRLALPLRISQSKEAGRTFSLVKIRVPLATEPVTRQTSTSKWTVAN